MKSLCKGCLATKHFGYCCFRVTNKQHVIPIYNGTQCPCVDCLVKSICVTKFLKCEKFTDFLFSQKPQIDALDNVLIFKAQFTMDIIKRR
jgi:hypothetical protein